MRKIYIALLIAIVCGGCTSRRQADGEPLYVSILPLRSLVQGIVGDDFDIEVLVPPGASPETFEPTPRQFVGLNKARMVFNVGLIDFEQNLLRDFPDRESGHRPGHCRRWRKTPMRRSGKPIQTR